MSNVPAGAARPRVLAIGFSPDEVEVLNRYAGSLQLTADLTEVHPEEHDVLLLASAESGDYRSGFPRRISFMPAAQSMTSKPTSAMVPSMSGIGGSSWSSPPTRSQTQFRPARDFEISAFTRDAGLEALVQRSCVPERGATYTGFSTPVHPPLETHVFLEEALDSPLALAALLQSDPDDFRPSSVFWLPAVARSSLSDWVSVAFNYWRQAAPERFPETAGWQHASRWASPAELDARGAIAAHETTDAARRAAADAQLQVLVKAQDSLEEKGRRWRDLLTETGEQLVTLVGEVLQELGFEVVLADELPHHRGKKREDLRVSDGDWVALAEVKGYARAAKSNDLQQLTAASAAYAAHEHRLPDALWYIPNTYRETDPAQREPSLAGREEDVLGFADNHDGCILETPQLFEIRQRVALSKLSASDARALLKHSLGRLRLDGIRATVGEP